MEKNKVIVVGAGHIGTTIAYLLASSSRYDVILGDISDRHIDQSIFEQENLSFKQLDISDSTSSTQAFLGQNVSAVVNCLPYFLNKQVVDFAVNLGSHYFDLTEDVASLEYVKQVAKGKKRAFVSHCGVAPGFINIVAEDLIKQFNSVEEVKLRCGALPQSASNALQYALTWSTDGLINEYLNTCYQLIEGKIKSVSGLGDLEEIQIDGLGYEAFNTSGGVATLLESHEHTITTLNYKTIRYPGHCEKMRFLAHGLKLEHDRETLKKIIEAALPSTEDDVVIIYVSVVGKINETRTRKAFVHKYYPREFFSLKCTAIKATTASSACAVIDTVLANPETYSGFVRQEQFSLESILDNHFGKYLNF